MSIESFNGGLGSGKTLRLTIWLYEKYLEGRKILANYNLHFPHEKVNPTDLINGLIDDRLDHATCGFTEAYTFLDSRFSGSEASRFQTYFILQTRKRDVEFGYDAQIWGSVDLRLRAVTNTIYKCSKILKDRAGNRNDVNNIVGFVYKVYFDDGYSYYEHLDIQKAIDMYFDLYDTTEILLPEYLAPTITIDDVLGVYQSAPNKNGFKVLLRANNPYISLSKCDTIYSLIEMGDMDNIKKVLRIK